MKFSVPVVAVLLTTLVALGAAVGPAHAEMSVEEAHGAPEDGSAHGDTGLGHEEHVPSFSDINFAHGFLGQKEGVEPSLAWRQPGTPPPLLAFLINAGILYWLLYRFGMPRIRDGLKHRRTSIMQGMDEAAKMKADAAKRVFEYEEKLAHIDSEIERVKKEMREAGKAEQARVLAEARERRERMERDSRLLIEQELKAARETLYKETVRSAVKSATAELEKQLTATDQQRIASEYLDGIQRSLSSTGGRV